MRNINSVKGNEEYSNQFTSLLGNFLNQKKQELPTTSKLSIDTINWNAKKLKRQSLPSLVKILEKELPKYEWFVTGLVNPALFSDDFAFQDPDVKLKGIKSYAEGVFKLFDQSCSRAEVIQIEISDASRRMLTVTWRLEGKVRLGPGVTIKPYVVYTDFLVDKEGLICFQEDRFSIPGYDILLSAFFPFLLPFLAQPAPSADALRLALKSKK